MASARGDGDGTSCHERLCKGSTLQGTNMSHLGKRKIIDSKVPAGREYIRSQEGNIHCWLVQLCWFTQILAMMKSCQKTKNTLTRLVTRVVVVYS